MKKKKIFWTSPWTIAIGSTVVASILLRIMDKIFGTVALNLAFKIISTPIVWIYSILTFEMPTKIFVLIIIFMCGVIVTFFSISRYLRNLSSEEKFTSGFINYNEDKFKDLYYHWDWIKGRDGKYRINNITYLCPYCKCAIIREKCPNCDYYFEHMSLTNEEVEALILHKIQSKNT